MQGRTHIVFGFLLSSIFWFIFHLPGDVVLMAWIGSILPDLDYRWREVRWVTHRRTLHNIWAMTLSTLAISLTLWYLKEHYTLLPPMINPWLLGVFFALGFLFHLLLDSTTKTGVMWLYPVKKSLYWKGPITTGSIVEKVIQTLIIISILAIVVFPRIRLPT